MIRAGFILVILSLFVTVQSVASNSNEQAHEGFNTIDYIFDHINDSHEWHFFSIGDKDFSIPLPVILYSKNSGLVFFSSNKLYHPSPNFQYYLETEGKNEGKIVERTASGDTIVPLDLSITKVIAGVILVALLFIVLALRSVKIAVKQEGKAPKGTQNLLEIIMKFVRDDVAKPFIGDNYKRYFPFLITLFLFILMSNLIGLVLPLGLSITSNIAVTLTLAVITFIITIASGNRQYWKHIFNPEAPWFMKTPVLPLMQIIEIFGVFIKPTILTIRLFANMLAGHIIITVLIALIFLMSSLLSPWAGAGMSLISVVFSIFMIILDILVAFIQAYIFTLLSAMYFGTASSKEH